MRHRMIAGLTAASLIAVMLATSLRPAHAMQAWISKVKSDCGSIQAEITLVWSHDDGGGQDNFRLELYDDTTGGLLTTVNESISKEQTPWFWQTHRMVYTASKWHYRIEIWDVDKDGKKTTLLDTVIHHCADGSSWRPEDFHDEVAQEPPPNSSCYAWVPFNSTNVAPETGQMTLVYSYGKNYEDQDYFVTSWRVNAGDYLEETRDNSKVPCGVYIKLYYQPDSTKQIYYMPSQYWPGDAYGTPLKHDIWGPVYHTVFPLNGAIRTTDD